MATLLHSHVPRGVGGGRRGGGGGAAAWGRRRCRRCRRPCVSACKSPPNSLSHPRLRTN